MTRGRSAEAADAVRSGALRRAALALLVGLSTTSLTACQDPPRPSPRRAPPRSALASAARPLPSESLSENRAEASSEALRACVQRLQRETPRALHEALAVLGEGPWLQAACRLDLALAQRDPALCEPIELQRLRDTCVARVAMVSGAPERCPRTPGLLGRDPTCVAVASRSVALCQSAGPAEQLRCLALTKRDSAVCRRLDPLLTGACERDLASLAPHLPSLRGSLARAGTLRLELSGLGDGGALARTEELRDAARGAFLDDAETLWLMDPGRGWPGPLPLFEGAPVVGLRVPLAGARAGASVPSRLRLLLPELSPLDSDDALRPALVRLTQLSRRRGGRVAGEVTFEGVAAGLALRVTLRFDTFLRDVVPRESLGAL